MVLYFSCSFEDPLMQLRLPPFGSGNMGGPLPPVRSVHHSAAVMSPYSPSSPSPPASLSSSTSLAPKVSPSNSVLQAPTQEAAPTTAGSYSGARPVYVQLLLVIVYQFVNLLDFTRPMILLFMHVRTKGFKCMFSPAYWQL